MLFANGCVAWPGFTAIFATLQKTASSSMESLGLLLLGGQPSPNVEQGTPATLDGESVVDIPSLVSIEISTLNPSFPKGTTIDLAVTAIYSNNTNQDVTSEATFQNLSPIILSLQSTHSQILGFNIGNGLIQASFQGKTANINLTVTNAILQSIQLSPSPMQVQVALNATFFVTGIYSDSTTADLTNHPNITYVSSNTSIANISSNGQILGIANGTTSFKAIFDSFESTAIVEVVSPTLTSIQITPNNPSIALGLTQNFVAIGNYSNGTSVDLTNSVTWISSDSSAAVFYASPVPRGQIQSLLEGSVTITAQLNSIISNSVLLSITQKQLTQIAISPNNTSLPKGNTLQFQAMGTFTDNSMADITTLVTWSSNDANIASISNGGGMDGLSSAVNVGSTTISLSYNTFSTSTSINVTAAILSSIAIVPVNASTVAGLTRSYSAIGTYSDSSTQNITQSVIWSVSDPSKATIDNSLLHKGLLTAISAGNIIIHAQLNPISGSTSGTILAGDTTPPTVISATSINPSTVQITFSEPINTIGALDTNNFKISNSSSLLGFCSNNSNFSNSSQTTDFAIDSISGSGSVYTLNLSSSQIFGKNYTVLVNKSNIYDLAAIPNNLGCSNSAGFEGQSILRISSSNCKNLNQILVTFSKPVKTGSSSGGAECDSASSCATKYKITGIDLGQITSAKILDGIVCGAEAANSSKVCITHTLIQNGAVSTIIGANATNGDGFEDTSYSAIRDLADSENLQSNPRDRASFSGCGTVPVNFSDGAISTNTFGDGTSFGYLSNYNNQIYIGPNREGNSAARFQFDGSNPSNIGFQIDKHNGARNTANSRDGGISVPPFVTMGHNGCIESNANLSVGCGPDNENGRGNFSVGNLFGSEILFMGGARNFPGVTFPHFRYLYYTVDTSTSLDFKYIQLGNITGSSTAGTQSFVTQNNNLYAGFAKFNQPSYAGGGASRNTPDFGFIKFTTNAGDNTSCLIGNNCEAGNNGRGVRFRIDRVPFFGGSSAESNDNTYTNYGLYTGVDSLIVFNNRIYTANGGHNQENHNGGIIRSNTTSPGACAGKYNCAANWTEITPRSNVHWHGSSGNWFSLELRKSSDFTPGDLAFAQFAEFNGNLFAIRTFCIATASNALDHADAISKPALVGCNDGTTNNRRPQLWKCDPSLTSGPLTCEAGDWSLVADNNSGITNFGSIGNHSATLLVRNGSYLYIGFDNNSGIEIWRTNVANPGNNSNEWQKVSTNGLGDPLNMLNIFSAISVPVGSLNYIYVSTGKTGIPLKIFRQQNN
ncbi:MAG: Ig-like domain-containing protein [Leptospiraceae bacterium]|nr:Ig-like domain-containing protein [Leptospiraceae bacterium]